MSALLLASAYLALIAPARGPISLSVDLKNGDVISGEKLIRVKVSSDAAINQVEFSVNGELKDTDTGTPYEFRFDSINESDGEFTLKFKAYTVENQTGEQTIKVKVDNQLGKGAPFHVDLAKDFLSNGDFNGAINEGRVALKIDDKNNPARLVLARAYLGKSVLDQAQKYAEDAVAQDARSIEALQTLASVNVTRSFATYAKLGSDQNEALSSVREALKSAVEARRKSLDLEVEAAGEPTGENAVRYADAALRAERYSLASSVLQSLFAKDQRNLGLANRLAYAKLRSSRPVEALGVINVFRKFGTLDAYGFALLAVTQIELGQDTAADDSMREAILADGDNLGVKTAQAFIALKRNKMPVLGKLVADLSRDQGQRADVNYLLMALSNRLQRYGDARKYFQRAVQAEPAYPDLFIEQGNYSISLTQASKMDQKSLDYQYESARVMYESALLARPDSTEALSGLAIVALLQKKPQDAVKFATAAVRAAPNDAGANYTLSAAYAGLKGTQAAALSQSANATAGKLDQKNLQGREIPSPLAAWRYLNTNGRQPVLSAPRG